MKSNRGSALLVAILLSAILLAALAGLLTVALNEYRGSLKSYSDTAAFSLAESGIDRAATLIGTDKLTSAVSTPPTGTITNEAGVWYAKTTPPSTDVIYYRGYFPSIKLGNNRIGTCEVILMPGVPSGTKTSYTVYSRGTVSSGENGNQIASQRALKVVLEKAAGSGGGSGFALAALSSITTGTNTTWPFKTGDSSGFLRIGSYDSWLNKKVDATTGRKIYDEPDWYIPMSGTLMGQSSGTNFGDKAIVATQQGTLYLNNTILYGTAAAATGATINTVQHYSQDGTSVVDATNGSTVVNLDIAKTTPFAYLGLNADAYNQQMKTYDIDVDASDGDIAKNSRLVKNYVIDNTIFSTPTLPGGFEDTKTILTASNAMQSLTLTSGNYEYQSAVERVNNITINGNVVLHMAKEFKTDGGALVLNFATDDSTLRIVADSMVDIKMSSSAPTYAPKQFELDLTSSSGLTINCNNDTDGFTGVIKAPLSKVQFSGNSSRDDTKAGQQKRQQLRGQIIAREINLPGSCNIDVLFDVQLSNGGDAKSEVSLSLWKQILPTDFTAQL